MGFDYERIGYTRVGDPVVTKSGMRRVSYEKMESDKLIKLITAEFSQEHPMFKKYGVREMKTSRYPSGNQFIDIKAKALGQDIEFKTNLWDKQNSPVKQVAMFLKNLKKVVKYKPTRFLERVANVAKYIK